ncbi:hypothetical protein Q8F55_005977 [Vanrija albida]|uniref:Peptidase M20 domain-containing protein 2 n=1 Tax=Vanrija albida TaxID=181172 RepID=A0ABR3Q325_9TREE
MTVTATHTPDGLTPALLDEVEAAILALTPALTAVQADMHAHPEIAWQEHRAHDTTAGFMEAQGWRVTRHAYGLQTAWRAEMVVGSGEGRVVGFNSELDALPHGHACGHNLIAIAGMAAAIGTAQVMAANGVSGRVVLLGTPAEEAYGGKDFLLQRGAYDEMDVCLMTHPGITGNGSWLPSMCCNAAFTIEYKGASAHAGAMPSAGVNALDAAVSGYTNVALLRQQIPDTHRIYNVLKGSEGWTANIITSNAKVMCGIRAPTAREVHKMIDRALNCYKAAALATGCSYTITKDALYLDTQHSTELDAYLETVTQRWAGEGYTYRKFVTYGTTDFGNVTYKCPALHPMFQLPDLPEGDFCHSDTYANHTATESAVKAALRSATCLAAVALRAAVDDAWMATVKTKWEAQMAACDGPATVKELEALLAPYPLSDVCAHAVCEDGWKDVAAKARAAA